MLMLNTRRNIRLPVFALLQQFKTHPDVALIRHYDILFVQQGVPGLSAIEQADLFPLLVKGFAEDVLKSRAHGAVIFNLIIKSILQYHFPERGQQEDTTLRARCELGDDDAADLAYWLSRFMALRLPPSSTTSRRNGPSISSEDFSFLTLDGRAETWELLLGSSSVTDAKLKISALLISSLMTSQEKLVPVILLASDQNSRVAESGEDLWKRMLLDVEMSEPLVQTLWSLYFGNIGSGDGADAQGPYAARPLARIKILQTLAKTPRSSNHVFHILRLVQMDLTGDTSDDHSAGPKDDRESNKLRAATLTFLSFVCRHAEKPKLAEMASVLIMGLKTFLDTPIEGKLSTDMQKARGRSFEMIGILSQSKTSLIVEPRLLHLRWLFQSLAEEVDKDVTFSIEGAISSTIRLFQAAQSEQVESALRELLLRYMSVASANARAIRFMALRFANRCLGYSDLAARWIDLLAIDDGVTVQHEMVEEARRGLDPHWYRLSQDNDAAEGATSRTQAHAERHSFPSFEKLMLFIHKHIDVKASAQLRMQSLSYCRLVLFHQARSHQESALEVDVDWERKLDLAVAEDTITRADIRRQLQTMMAADSNDTLSLLWNTACQGLTSGETSLSHTSAAVLLDLTRLLPEAFLSKRGSDLKTLESAILSNDTELRVLSARSYGILSFSSSLSRLSQKPSSDMLLNSAQAWRNAYGADANKAHGAILALGYYVAYHFQRHGGEDSTSLRLDFIQLLLEVLQHSHDAQLHEAACVALGQLCQYRATTVNELDGLIPRAALLKSFSDKAAQGREKTILALGQLAMVDDDADAGGLRGAVVDALHSLHTLKEVERQFAVGEALTYAAAGWQSASVLSKSDISPAGSTLKNESGSFSSILDRILADSATTKPALKKFCGSSQEVQDRLAQFQAVFKRCLSDRDELVQESASRGLGLVYDKGDQVLREDLVRDLAGSLTGNKASIAGTVSEDTQLFEAGALPTGDGSVTTYKDIMSLASEVGDSSLVYRFMSLASHNSIWSTRAAFGKFGLSDILQRSDYLKTNPKLIPKLFRYRFDPNPNARRAMTDIWHALVKDPNSTIAANLDGIMEDLLASILDREWRVREASCAAISDLIQGRPLDKVRAS
ncbi:hypothetical protein MRB53_037678 [Persea americana]|nr:hypothetical protein MRB53_037678 [Persea americana]